MARYEEARVLWTTYFLTRTRCVTFMFIAVLVVSTLTDKLAGLKTSALY